MSSAYLLFNHRSVNDLGRFCRLFEDSIGGASIFSEHYSSNYPGGYYFSGIFEGVILDVSISDEVEHTDLPYYVHMESRDMNDLDMRTFADRLSVDILLPNGFIGAFMLNFGYPEEYRIDY